MLVHKSMPFAVSNLANYVESKELKPLGEITDLSRRSIYSVSLRQEKVHDFVHQRFVLDESTHGEGIVDRST
jgi:hypothetical protein